MSLEYKLILISDGEGNFKVTYLKSGERHFKTLHLEETDMDKIIDKMLEVL